MAGQEIATQANALGRLALARSSAYSWITRMGMPVARSLSTKWMKRISASP
jgi:hypothetical protein